MSLREKIDNEFKQAFKSKSPDLATLRLIKNSIHLSEKEKKEELNNDEIIIILKKEKKLRLEAISSYKKAKRKDRLEDERKELKIIRSFLPEELSSDAIRRKVKLAISQLNVKGVEGMGKIMGKVMPEIGTSADGNKVSKIVKEELSKD